MQMKIPELTGNCASKEYRMSATWNYIQKYSTMFLGRMLLPLDTALAGSSRSLK